jgi:hypothetical protein
MKKIAIIALALMVALVFALPVSAADVTTEAVVGGSGSAPYVCAKFETPDMNPANGTQIDPKLNGKRIVKFYVVAGDPNGVDDISAVYIKVYHPDGTFKFQLDAIKDPALNWKVIDYNTGKVDMSGNCTGDTLVPAALDTLQAQKRIVYGYDPVREETMTLSTVKYDLGATPAKQIMVELKGLMDSHQVPGEYKVEAIVVDQGGKTGTLVNYFTYQSLVGLQIDFGAGISWGAVNVGKWNILYGDEDLSSKTKPTVKNTGNAPGKIQLHHTEMIGVNFLKKIIDFDAMLLGGHVEFQACNDTVITDGAGAPIELPPCTPTQIDFSIHPPAGTPEDTYAGTMTITILPLP